MSVTPANTPKGVSGNRAMKCAICSLGNAEVYIISKNKQKAKPNANKMVEISERAGSQPPRLSRFLHHGSPLINWNTHFGVLFDVWR